MSKPKATLALTSQCPHCPAVMNGLSQLLKQGQLSQLRMVNIEQDPEFATSHNIRGVPWFQIGELQFEGAHTPSELSWWAEHVHSASGIQRYLADKLSQGRLDSCLALIQAHPDWLLQLLPLLTQSDTPMQVRIGIGAMFEHLAGEPLLAPAREPLLALLQHSDTNIRIDICHLLAQLHDPSLADVFRGCLSDNHPEIQEIAQEALDALSE